MRHGIHYRLCRFARIRTLKYSGADEHTINAKLHAKGGISRRCDSSRGEIHNRQPLKLRRLNHKFLRYPICIRYLLEFFHFANLQESFYFPYLFIHCANMPDRLDNISAAGLALSTYHRRPFLDATKGFTQIALTANERHFEFSLINMKLFIRRSKNFAFIYKINFECFQYLRFHKMTYAALCHHR